MNWKIILAMVLASFFGIHNVFAEPSVEKLRIAAFNVSMEGNNYATENTDADVKATLLAQNLATGKHAQIKNIAEILQRIRPDIVLLNEFDVMPIETGIAAFQKNYLSVTQQADLNPIEYPHIFLAPSNTGEPSGLDLDGDGKVSGAADAWGYGEYPGQYGMILLSQYPIDAENARTLQKFRWRDMPGALRPVDPETGQSFYSDKAWQQFRLSSKSHWDVPVVVGDQRLHVLALHPTPPVFDGPENRNGRRNHDELRLIADYINGADYIVDDNGHQGGLNGERFVILGDLNASVYSKETLPGTMEQLLENPLINADFVPTSAGASETSETPEAAEYTAAWRSRADYVLPSKAGWTIEGGGVFWPASDDPLHRLVESREASSDHRLVWLDLKLD